MQQTLTKFTTWADIWQLRVAYDKCNVLSLGNLNRIPCNSYTLSSNVLTHTQIVRDIGINISSDFKFSKHCAKIVAKAQSRAYLLKKCFHSNNPLLLTKAFKIYIRPMLEADTQVWSPHLLKDIKLVEKVQRQFTKAICGRCNISYTDYKDRLSKLSLESLELRRVKFDLYMVYKIINNLVDLPVNSIFTFATSNYNTRGHPLRLNYQDVAINNQTLNFFSNRVVKWWNSLDESVILSPSFNLFKIRLDSVNLLQFCKIYN